jgi:hypothetical protein
VEHGLRRGTVVLGTAGRVAVELALAVAHEGRRRLDCRGTSGGLQGNKPGRHAIRLGLRASRSVTSLHAEMGCIAVAVAGNNPTRVTGTSATTARSVRPLVRFDDATRSYGTRNSITARRAASRAVSAHDRFACPQGGVMVTGGCWPGHGAPRPTRTRVFFAPTRTTKS